jgi:hypothetical protein
MTRGSASRFAASRIASSRAWFSDHAHPIRDFCERLQVEDGLVVLRDPLAELVARDVGEAWGLS